MYTAIVMVMVSLQYEHINTAIICIYAASAVATGSAILVT